MKSCIGKAVLAALVNGGAAVHLDHRRATPLMTGYPVSKVVDLLRNMRAELEKEGEADEEVYEKLDCWCETNDKAKTKAIADAEARLVTLQATIEQNLALSASLKVEIQGLDKEVAENQKSLEEATAMRAKAKEDFLGDEKEMIGSIQALNAAVIVLSKHHPAGGAAASALATIRTQLHRHEDLLRGVITPKQRHTLVAFMQAGGASSDYFDSAPTFKQAYAPQSGEIFGILSQMKATFEADLTQAQKDEVAAQEVFANVTVAKQDEIRAGQASLLDKREQLATADETVATSKADREDTQGTLSVDEQFLLKLKNKCRLTDDEWVVRKQTRAAELSAVNEAIGLLSTDEARELFNTNFNRAPASFLQVHRSRSGRGRESAASLLANVAARLGSPKLSALATSVRLDTFVRVKKAIDDMVGELAQEKADEIQHRDLCVTEFDTNERSTAKELHTKKNWESQISMLELKVNGINETIEGLNNQIGELNAGRDGARTNRELERTAFEAVLAEQKASEALLQQAVTALKKQYAANGVAALVQQSPSPKFAGETPKDFAGYEKNRKGQGVLALLDHIISACKQMQEESLQAEAAARDAYTDFVQQTTESVQSKQAAVIDRSSELAVAKQDKLQAESELGDTVAVLGTLATGLADLHTSCDYLIKNFDARQEARNQEVDALRQAKAFLSGME